MSLVVFCSADDTLVLRTVAKFIRDDMTIFPKVGDPGRIKWTGYAGLYDAVVVYLSVGINHAKDAKAAAKDLADSLTMSGRRLAVSHGFKLKDGITADETGAESEPASNMESVVNEPETTAADDSLKRKVEDLQQELTTKFVKTENENKELKTRLDKLYELVAADNEKFATKSEIEKLQLDISRRADIASSSVSMEWTAGKLLDECEGEKQWTKALARGMNKMFSLKELNSSCPTVKGAHVSPAERSPLDPKKMDIIYEFVKLFCLGRKLEVPRPAVIHTKLRSFLQTCRKSYARDWNPKDSSGTNAESDGSQSISESAGENIDQNENESDGFEDDD